MNPFVCDQGNKGEFLLKVRGIGACERHEGRNPWQFRRLSFDENIVLLFVICTVCVYIPYLLFLFLCSGDEHMLGRVVCSGGIGRFGA